MTEKSSENVSRALYGQPGALRNLTSYQPDSIVSARLIQKETGNVTFFAFDEGQELSEHTAPFDALLTLFDGSASIMVGGVWHELSDGDAIILPANIPHAVKAQTRFKMMLTMIRS